MPVYVNLEMQVIAGRIAGMAHIADQLPGTHAYTIPNTWCAALTCGRRPLQCWNHARALQDPIAQCPFVSTIPSAAAYIGVPSAAGISIPLLGFCASTNFADRVEWELI